MDSDVIVLGGGVIGLTSAIRLAEAGARVRVWSRDPVGRTTSAVAGGLWEPYRIEPRDRVAAWARESFGVLAGLAADPENTGVRMVAGVQALEGAAADGRLELPYWARDVPGVRQAGADELPPGCTAGFRATVPLVDMPAHLDHLVRRLAAAGGRLEQRTAASIGEAARHARCVVNCTGLAARDLVPDPRVRPVRGQIVIVENPGLREWFVAVSSEGAEGAEATYLFPQPYGLLLGGTADDDAWDTTPDPAVAAVVVARCARVEPRVATARVLAHRSGLRPCRDAVRLEVEHLPGGRICIHNYGHGGAGVTVSWGCAAEVAALAASAVR